MITAEKPPVGTQRTRMSACQDKMAVLIHASAFFLCMRSPEHKYGMFSVFIDFLNEKKLLELDTQIICFIGANTNQNTWYNTAVKYIQSLNQKTSFNLTPIRILTEGSNALDMVLSSYVGLAMGQNSRAEFIIVSNDKGYESVVEHFGSLGVKINRLSINNTKQSERQLLQRRTNQKINLIH